jgi:hypothetical protein
MFYEIDVDLYRQLKYCYAGDIRTENESIISRVCPRCHTPYLLPLTDILLDLERGSQYPDFLPCPSGIFVVSENVLNEWEKKAVHGYKYYNAKIDRILSKSLKEENKKKYYHIIIEGFCDWDREKTDIEIMSSCNICGSIKYREKWETGTAKFVFDLDTWNHADIFKTSISHIRFCTKKIVEIALQNKHTGANFCSSEYFLVGDKKCIKNVNELQ